MPAPTTSDYLNQTTPAAPSGDQNCVIQSDGGTPSQDITVYPKTATSSLRGTVKPDNSSITIAGDGTISAVGGAVASLTTTGTSGAATLSAGVLNIPQYASGGGGSPIFNRAAYTSAGRAFGTVYQNTSSYPLIVCAVDTTSSAGVVAYTDSSSTPTTIVGAEYGFSSGQSAVMFVVMPGNYYKVTGSTWYALGRVCLQHGHDERKPQPLRKQIAFHKLPEHRLGVHDCRSLRHRSFEWFRDHGL